MRIGKDFCDTIVNSLLIRLNRVSDVTGCEILGKAKFANPGNSITEGIVQGHITKNLEDAPVDKAFQISDQESLPYCFDLLKYQGWSLGGSPGINIAVHLAHVIGAGHTIVAIFCDFVFGILAPITTAIHSISSFSASVVYPTRLNG
jgi:cysteine synthase